MFECIAKVGKKSHGFWLLFGVFFFFFVILIFFLLNKLCVIVYFSIIYFFLTEAVAFHLIYF